MVDRVLGLVHRLRAGGVPVSPAEVNDCLDALGALPLDRPEQVGELLALTLVKRREHLPLFWSVYRDGWSPAAGEPGHPVPDAAALVRALADLLLRGDTGALAALAGALLDAAGNGSGDGGNGQVGGGPVAEPGPLGAFRSALAMAEGVANRYNLRGLAPRVQDALRRRLAGQPDWLQELVLREVQPALERLESQVRLGARRRWRLTGGPDLRVPAAPGPLDLPLVNASSQQLAAMRRTARGLGQKLAARLRRRAFRRGQVDFRRTVRASLRTGGIPFTPVLRSRRRLRPAVVCLCDISSSVGDFSAFALLLVHCLRREFRRVRSFAFVDHMDEITHFLRPGRPADRAVQEALRGARVVTADGRTDYGRALASFQARYPSAVNHTTSVLVLGDARSNGRPPRLEVVADLKARARRVVWLNPEQARAWGTGDSLMRLYLPHVDRAYPCANLRELVRAIASLPG